ncbi:IS1380 family transposase [Telmatocola sphagniphila]|uniref:IS1380 family transposase n=2 Tax=Telmatocola sphagniphila TaxID=1123043 RepID=A0A8E6ETG8_9BACT|nr:IS1380 family transposase [Telmatocola sphagniphila]QVL29917.1 IS1380 family transposase [Telmatocola sphagniphila]QVL33382.1 IS1380 family transposase [Telmatocola sphagniphila]
MNVIFGRWFQKCKSRIERRLAKREAAMTFAPSFDASNIHYEVSERVGAISCGGLGAMHLLARRIGLIDDIDEKLHLLQFQRPYSESDHVLAIAYNSLCGGTCLQDMELRRTDENFLNALGTQRFPDPTTSGDFCRRFDSGSIQALIDAFNQTRLRVWSKQPDSFWECAKIDADGSFTQTRGERKAGMDINYNRDWCYHPLAVTLANTGETLSIVNRPGNRPSHEGAAVELDRALLLCLQAGFRRIVFRGDTDFSQTTRLDGWDANAKVRFYFGYDSKQNLEAIAENLPEAAWHKLERPAQYSAKAKLRHRRENTKERIVQEREFVNVKLISEAVAEFEYQPTACRRAYRLVVIRKNLSVEKGESVLYPDERYFFYITNDRECTAAEVVYEANDRCNQENLIAQLKGGCRALHAPLHDLESNWAYMVMASLAWNLKAWWALTLPETPGRWREKHRDQKQSVLKMEFKTFLNAFMLLPCQIVRKAGRIVYRLLGWNPHLPIFFRLLKALRC